MVCARESEMKSERENQRDRYVGAAFLFLVSCLVCHSETALINPTHHESSTPNPETETLNPKPEIWNPKPNIRSPKPETRNPKLKTLNGCHVQSNAKSSAPVPGAWEYTAVGETTFRVGMGKSVGGAEAGGKNLNLFNYEDLARVSSSRRVFWG